MNVKGASILFDLDGTLVDSAPDLWRALSMTLESVSATPMALEDMRVIAGIGTEELVERSLRLNGIACDDTKISELSALFEANYEFLIRNDAQSLPFPGVLSSLQKLHAAKAKLAVCTNKATHLAQILIQKLHMSEYFDSIAGWDTYEFYKPHPEHLLLTLKTMGGVATKAVMIGDSDPDILAAKAAGIPVIGVTFGYTDTPVASFAPDRIVSDFHDIPDIVVQILEKSESSRSIHDRDDDHGSS